MSVHSLTIKETKKPHLTASMSVADFDRVRAGHPSKAMSHVHLRSQNFGPRLRTGYISAFDDKFKVDLNIDDSPSVSAVSQKPVDFSKKMTKIRNLFMGVLLIVFTSALISINLLVDLKFLDVKSNLIFRYFHEFCFMHLCFCAYLFFSLIGLKLFKHN